MEEFLRLAVLLVMMAPAALTDWRERAAYGDMICLSLGIAACFLAYDIISGNMLGFGPVAILANSAMFLVATVLAAARRISGEADMAYLVMVMCLVPGIAGLPVGLFVMLAGFAMGLAYLAATSLYRNLDDMLHGRPYSRWILITHIKRRGERHCTMLHNNARINGFEGDSITTTDGGEFMVGNDKYGMEVTKTIPAVTFLTLAVPVVAAGMLAVDMLGIPAWILGA